MIICILYKLNALIREKKVHRDYLLKEGIWMTEIHLLLKDCTSITTKVILSECDGNILFSPLNLISFKTHTHTCTLVDL